MWGMFPVSMHSQNTKGGIYNCTEVVVFEYTYTVAQMAANMLKILLF